MVCKFCGANFSIINDDADRAAVRFKQSRLAAEQQTCDCEARYVKGELTDDDIGKVVRPVNAGGAFKVERISDDEDREEGEMCHGKGNCCAVS